MTGHLWLEKTIQEYENKQNDDKSNKNLIIPLKQDGSRYYLNEAKGVQRLILYHIFDTIKKWVTNDSSFVPFHRIITGAGGSGKSYLIQQITSAIRQMFGKNETVETSAFTGAAAYNIRGSTIHSAYSINCMNSDMEMSQLSRDKLIRRMRHTVALLFDERSMISAEVLGAAERNVALTCHGGNKHKMKWGGIPIILLFGDDYQLPPVQIKGKGKGAFHAIDYTSTKYKSMLSTEVKGIQEFVRLSKDAFNLDSNERIQNDQNEFKELLNRVRIGKPTEEDKAILLSLSLHKIPRQIREQHETSSDTLNLFATREMCCDHNFKKLKEHSTEENPVAFLKHRLPKHYHEKNNDQNAIPQATCFSRGCKVSIKGRNFCPILGLYNGAIGTVEEIVYKPNETPNTGNLPLYVAVNFPGYLGHKTEFGKYVWDTKLPTVIPVPMIKTIDEKTRKSITYCPLVLSFARTIHTYQGQSAGPTKDNSTNAIMRLICDVGTARFESQNIGLLYTALSRATTIGSIEKQRTDSAIFFTHSLDKSRLDRLSTKSDNDEYEMIKRRNKWINLLTNNRNSIRNEVTNEQINSTLEWATVTRIPIEKIEDIIR